MKYFILLLFSTISLAQKIFKDEQFNFSIQEPVNWIKAEKNESINNFKEKINLSEEKIDYLIEKSKGKIEIVTFYKYPINSVNGVIPTIKVNLHKNPTKSINSFKMMIEKSIEHIKTIYFDLKLTNKLEVTKLNGKDCVCFESIYSIPVNDGTIEIKTICYSVPVGKYYFNITFMEPMSEDNQQMFKELINSIRIL
ncbi:Hypothetical protein precursor [Flavobacterium indicum GPTSA100-9 = DSM 17447]|uniref:PsbP C-terminal domain-containing protein n=1 Tax=Flavobacterium indicum (strain DSM 17447 / CIP 109464 / GPTSA100-9) TaxID=1094466 RepID=H8XPA4_FLAIG|nr:hypothetical protein [Flavobacterium indicum]CCG53178.1 Hypothetical protein precursor [Flavobacterium indicum GPTSA100-9 = DSM 17447]